MRIDTHHHLIYGIDDGCRHPADVLANARLMLEHGYSKIFCTPHFGVSGFNNLTVPEVAELTEKTRRVLASENLPLEIRPGGELRLDPKLPETAKIRGVPTFGQNTKHVLIDLWEKNWPTWATRAVEWLLLQGYIVTLAHPERMAVLQEHPPFLNELTAMGLRLQGTLGPLGKTDSPQAYELAARFLQDGRYWLLGSDAHRPDTLAARLTGLAEAVQLVGQKAVDELTITNPAELWVQ